MIWLLKYWKPLAVALLLLGVWLHGDRNGSSRVQAKWDAEVAQANLDAIKKKAEIDQIARDKESRDALHAINLEAEHARQLEAVRNGSAAFVDTLTRRLRNAEAGRSRCELSSAAADTGVSQERTGEPEGGYRGPDLKSSDRLRTVGLTLQAELRDCRAWVLKHGR